MPRLRARWPSDHPEAQRRREPRDDVVREEAAGEGRFTSAGGPFRSYERSVADAGGELVEVIDYRLGIPWWGWLFALPARHVLRHPPAPGAPQPWWAPPARLDQRSALVLGLVAAASVSAGYLNTLFTQTVAFAADDFGASNGAQGVAGAIVRVGLLLALPLMLLADRWGRRSVLVLAAAVAPVLCSLGAVAPTFASLTLTQTLGRPVAVVLLLLVAVVAAEEMPAGSRAYAVSVLAMAAGLGAGLCLVALPLAGLGPAAWRLVYLLPLVFALLAIDLHRRLPETHRFTAHRHAPAAFPRRRFALLAATALLVNLMVAPASFFQNRYLKDVRGFSALMISIFSLAVGTPAGAGIVVGGRLADTRGRRIVGATALGIGAVATAATFAVSGVPLWVLAAVGSIVGAAAIPALGVYGAELFPTGHRGRASGLISLMSLVGSTIGLLAVGQLVDAGWSYGQAVGAVAIGPVIACGLVLGFYPETRGAELEDLNPEDRLSGPI